MTLVFLEQLITDSQNVEFIPYFRKYYKVDTGFIPQINFSFPICIMFIIEDFF